MEKVDIIKNIIKNPTIKKKLLVNFKPGIWDCTFNFSGNDMLPAWVSKYTGPTKKGLLRVFVQWDNGFMVVAPPNALNFKEINDSIQRNNKTV